MDNTEFIKRTNNLRHDASIVGKDTTIAANVVGKDATIAADAVGEGAKDVGNAINKGVTNTIQGIRNVGDSVNNTINNTVDDVGNAIDDVGNAVASVFTEKVGPGPLDLLPDIGAVVTNSVNAIGSFATALCQIIDLGVEIGETALDPNAPLRDPLPC